MSFEMLWLCNCLHSIERLQITQDTCCPEIALNNESEGHKFERCAYLLRWTGSECLSAVKQSHWCTCRRRDTKRQRYCCCSPTVASTQGSCCTNPCRNMGCLEETKKRRTLLDAFKRSKKNLLVSWWKSYSFLFTIFRRQKSHRFN